RGRKIRGAPPRPIGRSRVEPSRAFLPRKRGGVSVRRKRGPCSFPRLRGKVGMGAGSAARTPGVAMDAAPTPALPRERGGGCPVQRWCGPCSFPRLRGKVGMGAGGKSSRRSASRRGDGGGRRLCHYRLPAQDSPMSRLDSISGKMMDLVGQVGDSVRHTLPDGAGKWLQAGMALGAAKAGSRAAGRVLRRNPAVLVAAAVGIGAAWYAVHRYRRKQQANGDGQVIEGKARRVEARRASRKGDAPSGDGTSVRRRSSRARQATADTPAGNE